MSTNTTNYNLKKPAANDNYNVDDQNGNMDIIDAALKRIESKYFVDTASSTDAYTISITGITDYTQLIGIPIWVKVNTANSSAATLNVNNLGAKNITRGVSTALVTGDVLASQIVEVVYDGTQFQLKNQGADVSYASKSETLTNKTLTAPKITSGSNIADSGGNELIKFPATVTSAINEITVSNAAAGSAPSVEATGGDTNINLNLKSKGTGKVQANGVDVITAAGGNLTGPLAAQNGTDYTTKQVRNITLSTADASGGANGDIWITYTP